MKTNLKSLFLILAIAVPFMFTSCEGSDDVTTPEIVLQGDIRIIGDNYVATVLISCAETSSINSVTARVIFNDGESDWDVSIPNNAISRPSGQLWNVTITFPRTRDGMPVEALSVRAETRDGGNRTRVFRLEEEPGNGGDDTPLSSSTEFTLGRPAGTGAPESAFGITWTTNPNATTARFTAQNIVLTQAQYNAITTREELAAFAHGRQFASTFEAQSDANFGATKFYIIQDGSTLRLVQFTSLRFVAGANRAHFTERH